MPRASTRQNELEPSVPDRQRRLQNQFRISTPPANAARPIIRLSVKPPNSGQQEARRRSDENEALGDVINVAKPSRKPLNPGPHSDEVDEYIFSSEDDTSDNDDAYDSEAARSHISVSSSDSPERANARYALEERPWLHMDPQTRRNYETMFLNIASPPLGESWIFTEEYQLQVDILMLKYIEDFPLSTWAVGPEAADMAFRQFRHRISMRQIGVKIYSTERMPEILHAANNLAAMQTPMPVSHPQTENLNRSEALMSVPPPQIATSNHLAHQTPMPMAEQHGHIHRPMSPPQHIATPRYPYHTHPNPDVVFAPVPAVQKSDTPKPARLSLAASILLSRTDDNYSASARAGASMDEVSQDDDTDDDAEVQIRKHSFASQSQSRTNTPPYPGHKRSTERKIVLKLSKRNARKHAEAEIMPWHRRIDFKAAKAAASWDDNYRHPSTVQELHRVRAHNAPIIERLDQEAAEKQRADRHRYAKKRRGEEQDSEGGGRKRQDPADKTAGGEAYHSGSFAFATAEDSSRAKAVGCGTPEDVIEQALEDMLDSSVLDTIRLCWRPGKKITAYGLEQGSITATESIITRKKLATTHVLTWKAAECIIDYCPDLLWRDILLRICSESGMGNKDVRDRFCLNGCHADKATFTKRISSALGQKQAQSKAKGYVTNDKGSYVQNSRDFDSYISFFGKRTTARHPKAGVKRKPSSSAAEYSEIAAESSEMEDVIHVASKKSALEDSSTSDVDMDDSLSAQDSEDLDAMSE